MVHPVDFGTVARFRHQFHCRLKEIDIQAQEIIDSIECFVRLF